MSSNTETKLTLEYDAAAHRRVIAGKEVIIHCHHYNSRLQRTVEGVAEIDGKALIRNAAESVFAEHVATVCDGVESAKDRFAAAGALYSHLGFGKLDFANVSEGAVSASESHFVEGWRAGAKTVERNVCTFTEGFLQGAIRAVNGKNVRVVEDACIYAGAERCRFSIKERRASPATNQKHSLPFEHRVEGVENDSNIDEQAIIDALVGMHIYGNDDGLIPAFGVYLANTPADFYNHLNIHFVEVMREKNLFETARRLLVEAGESCAMNTFRGIMQSPEWEGLVQPMVKDERDKIFGLVALSNGFGWGNWRVREHDNEDTLRIESLNGYEAIGFREYRDECDEAQCFMLVGVAAGMMELIYSVGSLEDRYGTYLSEESSCICAARESCHFKVDAA